MFWNRIFIFLLGIGYCLLSLARTENSQYVSFNFQDVPVRSAIQLLANFGHVNVVINDSVKGNMTLHIQQMPWKEALNIVLKVRGLEARAVDGVMFIAPMEEIMQLDEMEQKRRETMEAQIPLSIESIFVRYADVNELMKTLTTSNSSFLSVRGHMNVDKRTNTLLIQDIPEKIETIKQVIKMLDTPVRQVLIEARIVTVNRNFEKDLGIQFGMSQEDMNISGSLEAANDLANGTTSSITDRLNVDFSAVSSLGSSPGSIAIALAKLGGGIMLDLELSALESEGEGKVISRPRLVTANQKPAFIESGEEIPYQESTSSGATAVSFKKAVLRLKVTPKITPNNKVMMELVINQDMPNGVLVNGVPEVMTKEIQTNVVVQNRQTIVLGGIYRQDKSHSVERIPFLSDVPGIGSIFQKKTDKITYEELLIFITPKIIDESA